MTPSIFADHIRYILGDKVMKKQAKDEFGTVVATPDFALCMSYEYEIRKAAVTLVNDDHTAFDKAMEEARKDPDIKESYFSTPMSMTRKRVHSEAFPSAPAGPAHQHQQHQQAAAPQGLSNKAKKKAAAAAAKGKAGGKDKGKKGKGKGKMPPGCKLKSQTPDGNNICYAFGNGSCTGSCGLLHACQVCFDTGHAYPACPKVAAAGGLRTA